MERYETYKDSGVEWIGAIPQKWRVSTIGRIGQLGRGRVISNIEINENPGNYPVYSSQTKDGGVMGYLGSYDFQGEYVLWTTDGANAGTVTRRVGQFNCTNVCGTLQPNNWDEIDLRFLPYFLNLGTRFSVRLDINPKLMNGMMAKVPLVLPPKDEQTAIANFLDRKTAEIDVLIAQKERLLELYEEEKTAIINHAVTKGLDPNAELKDSGVEWLGEIPVEWEVKKLKFLVSMNDESLPEDTDERFLIKYVDISNVKSGVGILCIEELSFASAPSRARRIVREGDVIVSTVRTYLRSITKISNPPDNLIVSTGFAVIRPRRLNSDYTGYMFYSENLIGEIVSRSTGVSYPAINASDIGNIPVPVPTTEEQTAIANFLDRKMTEINAKITKTQRIIELQKEYRTALISEVVTGKIKVPELPTQEASA